MTKANGEIVRLSSRDWAKIVTTLAGFLVLAVASWSSLQVSVARLETQTDALGSRIAILEEIIRARVWFEADP